MSCYVDTSALVSALTDEVHSAQTDEWFAARSKQRFFMSDWVVIEFSSALSIKMWTGKLTAEGRSIVLGAFSVIARSFEILPILREHFERATLLANRHELTLRSGDALHLAICSAYGIEICTLDRRLRDAAILLGIGAVMPTLIV